MDKTDNWKTISLAQRITPQGRAYQLIRLLHDGNELQLGTSVTVPRPREDDDVRPIKEL